MFLIITREMHNRLGHGIFLKKKNPHYKSMEANGPWGMASLDSKGRLEDFL